jgi:hypothetical protein
MLEKAHMLARQIKAVLMTYLNRRAYHLLLLTLLAGLAISLFARRHYSWQWPITTVLVEGLITFLVPGSALIALILFFVQARHQLMGLSARLFPHSRPAHLIVIGAIFFNLTLAISSMSWKAPRPYTVPDGRTYWFDGVSPVGQSVVVLALMTLAAYTALRPWLSPVLGFALIYAINDKGGWISFITRWWGPDWSTGVWATLHQMRIHDQLSLRAAVFLANIIALEQLVRLARPRPQRPNLLASLWHRITTSPRTATPSAPAKLLPHTPMTGLLTRGRHRRFAVHSHTAPWVLAIAIGVVLAAMFLISSNTRHNDRVMATLVMLTLIPGVVVATGWRERWSSLGYESLLPSRRSDFVSEIAVALAADLAIFWLAALITSTLVLAAFSPRSVASAAFSISVLASALIQLLWLGVIFLASRFRQIPLYITVLIGTGLLMLLPIFQSWSDPHGIRTPYLLATAIAESTAGLLMLLTALTLWRRADLA